MPEPKSPPKRLHPLILLPGAILSLGSALIAGRLLWEETLLTWRSGPQMVGFSLAHGTFAFLLSFPFLLTLWTIPCIAAVLLWACRHRPIQRTTLSTVAAAIAVLGILLIPSSFWDRLFAARLAASPHASAFLHRAAAEGDLSVVKALLAHGVPIDAVDQHGDTPLHLAAATGKTGVVQYLVTHGAALNAINLDGESPLHTSIVNRHPFVTRALTLSGAKDISGDPTQGDRANEAIVRSQIEAERSSTNHP
ncbi:Ankyrin repeat-containing protein [Granulicella pectinivorans]|uniref:Ankyrin repeat-containing protein n=1 Tax=Granulicella pectinivorans TaxID=474950 RepID=A0A1I6MXY9_9BACT|nr:ankyrin repeat domain-containing protein [Granulicella pectinivorans]SFS20586.1 Ankyrin repeat-containing protein [Granulicella pectinivorans]